MGVAWAIVRYRLFVMASTMDAGSMFSAPTIRSATLRW